MSETKKATIYVVVWAEHHIVKCGMTTRPARVRYFENRGASTLALFPNQDWNFEQRILKELAQFGQRAFRDWRESVWLLGVGGLGFTECYKVDEIAFREFSKYVLAVQR